MTEQELLSELSARGKKNDPARRHLGNPRVQNLLEQIHDTGAVDIVISLLEDMERTNMKLLQKAETAAELITCREFAKCCGLLIKKLKRGNAIKKKQNTEDRETSEKFLKGDHII